MVMLAGLTGYSPTTVTKQVFYLLQTAEYLMVASLTCGQASMSYECDEVANGIYHGLFS